MMDQTIAQKLRTRIKGHEGLRLFPYIDSAGLLTIGYGRNLKQTGISETEADIMLGNDVVNATAELYRFIPWMQDLDDGRKAAFIELNFNMGIESLLKFSKMLAAAKDQRWEDAAKELINSEWHKQVGENRAHDIAFTIETGKL